MQLIRPTVQAVFDENYKFNPDEAVKISEGSDVTLVSTGYMTAFAKQAAEELKAESISVELLHYPSVKPFDAATLIESAKKTGGVVTVENQNIIGGLGGTVCEVLSENCPTKVKRLGIPDQFGEVATEQYLFDKHGFGPEHIKAACREMAK
jgi:transketolase